MSIQGFRNYVLCFIMYLKILKTNHKVLGLYLEILKTNQRSITIFGIIYHE